MAVNSTAVEDFIARWRGADGSELANAQSFTRELCEMLEVPVPDPARADTRDNAYVFERRVIFNNADGSTAEGRIDCFRRGAFVLENKKLKQGEHTKGFGVAMLAAHKQAEQYARALPAHEGRPPFLMVVDVGNIIEVFAEFSRSGATYTPFPDPRSHRIKIDDLRDENIRERLRTIWLDPSSLDPTRQSAKVTREIATQLAGIAKSLEAANYGAERVGGFLTRCLFTFFAEDVGLLPRRSFTDLLESLAQTPDQFVPLLTELWQAMDVGKFSVALRLNVLQFNGKLFKNPDVLPLDRDQIALLIEAGRKDWSQVEPAIFGTLLERALNPTERHALGAHYTPRAYVERLVLPTVIEPLREEWSNAQTAALTLANEGNIKEEESNLSAAEGKRSIAERKSKEAKECFKSAENVLREFQHRLCNVRVLDPACGSGNFLYVTLEHLKRLEGEVLNQLHDLNVSMSLETEGLTVDPHQFLGIELNPRAASIAEMVLWIGYLQWHFKTKGSAQPPQPVLRDFKNIENRDAVLAYDSVELLLDEKGVPVSRWDGKTYKKHPVTGEDVPDESAQITIEKYINPHKAEWPQADFVVGNPPYLGARTIRLALGDGYLDAIRGLYLNVPDNADFVMYWWDKSAELVCAKKLEQFGFITTNSIKQEFSRKILTHHFATDSKFRISFCIPDHPWVDNADGAAVRVAMTVAGKGMGDGKLSEITREIESEAGEAEIELKTTRGKIAPNLRVGIDIDSATALKANAGLSCVGYQLTGTGFVVDEQQAKTIDPDFGAPAGVIWPLYSGRDLTQSNRSFFAIDVCELKLDELSRRKKEIYQWLLTRVKPERDNNARASVRDNWWVYGEARRTFRPALKTIKRAIATSLTAKFRTFQFIESHAICDSTTVMFSFDDSFYLGLLSSYAHVAWCMFAGGTLEDRPRYNKGGCFEPFPFPDATEEQKGKIRELAEQLDAHRKKQQAQHPELTLTGMYNVLEKLKSSETLNAKEKTIHEQGLVSVLKQLHDELDHAVLDAYGWWDLQMLQARVNGEPIEKYAHELPTVGSGLDVAMSVIPQDRQEAKRELDERILERLVSLNGQRAREEQEGLIRWLRPEYQNPQGNSATTQIISVQSEMDIETEVGVPGVFAVEKQAWPKGDIEQVKAVIDVLAASKSLLDVDAIAAHFTGKGAWKKRLPSILEMLVVVGKVRMDAAKYGMA